MQAFAEFMAESFHSNAELTWNFSPPGRATASFTVDAVKVVVSFEERAAGGSPVFLGSGTRSQRHVVFEVERGDTTEVVYSAFSIFNGVFQAVQEFMEVREPESVVFATKRDALAGIYETYLRKEAATPERLGYVLEGPQRVDPFMEFTLKRTKPSGWKG
jgi:hypothetical protein